MNIRNLMLSLVSGACILFLFFTKHYEPEVSFEPFIFDTDWTIFHWFSYFLPWSLLSYIICRYYRTTTAWKIYKIIILCGKRLYEIFLFQMLVFGLSPLPGSINVFVSLLPLVALEWKQMNNVLVAKC